jgi:hypothetical protein
VNGSSTGEGFKDTPDCNARRIIMKGKKLELNIEIKTK